jgi:hypothetical protein
MDVKTLLLNQPEYWEFFKVANLSNHYEPPQEWITQTLQNKYRLGYSKKAESTPAGSYELALQRLPAYVGNAILLLKNILDSGKLKIHQSKVVQQFFEDYCSLLDEASRLSITRWLDSLAYNLLAQTVTLMPCVLQEGALLLSEIELKQAFQRLCYALCYGPAACLLPQLQAVSEQVLQDMQQQIEELKQAGNEQTKMYIDLVKQVEMLKTVLKVQPSKEKKMEKNRDYHYEGFGAVVDVKKVGGTAFAGGIFTRALVKAEKVEEDALALALLRLDDVNIPVVDKMRLYQDNSAAIQKRMQEIVGRKHPAIIALHNRLNLPNLSAEEWDKRFQQLEVQMKKLEQPQASGDSPKNESINSVASFTSPISQPHDRQQRIVASPSANERASENIVDTSPRKRNAL